jgi:hypothetical protein
LLLGRRDLDRPFAIDLKRCERSDTYADSSEADLLRIHAREQIGVDPDNVFDERCRILDHLVVRDVNEPGTVGSAR